MQINLLTDWTSIDSHGSGQDPIQHAVNEVLIPEKYHGILLNHTLLDASQERKLIEKHHAAQEKLNSIFANTQEENGAINLVHRDQIEQLQKQLREIEITLLKHNWRWIFQVAQKYFKNIYHFKNLSERKLLFAGAQGLIAGIRKFKLDKGNRLLTYVTHDIKDYIRRAIRHEREIILNFHHDENRNLFREVEKKFLRINNVSEVDYKLLAKHVGIEFENLLRFAKELGLGKFSSLSRRKDSDINPIELIAAQTQDAEFEMPILQEPLAKLNSRQRLILALKYGIKYSDRANDLQTLQKDYPKLNSIDFNSTYTLEEIGEKLKLSRERIRQIENKAFDILMNSLQKYQVKFHWIPDTVDIKSLKNLFCYLFEHKQKIFTKLDEFTIGLLRRLTNEKINYRDREQVVLSANEEEILKLRLTESDDKAGRRRIAETIAKERKITNIDAIVEQINKVAARAIKKIYAFFNAKQSPSQLRNFFNTEKQKPKAEYSKEAVVEACKKYLG